VKHPVKPETYGQLVLHKLQWLGKYLRHLGPLGLFLLAIVDAFPIPTFAGPDILTAVFSARHHEPWYLFAGIATSGSVIGAVMVFRMSRRAGLGYLNKKFGELKVASMLKFFERWGTGALIISTLFPVPFPTSAFFAAAGVLNYPLRIFILVVALSRALRYGTIAAFSAFYGRRFIVGLQHPGQHIGWILGISAMVAVMIALALLIKWRLNRIEARQQLPVPIPE